ncbi:MAG: phosphatase PAP2 family protein, partial [Chloroflexota bacterium]
MNLGRILEIDRNLTARIRVAENPGALRSFARFLGHSGDSWFWFAGLIILFFGGTAQWQFRAIVLFASILVTAGVVLALKFSFRRARPEGEWGQIYRKTDPHSFPSGHAARGLLIGVLAFGLGPAWFGWLLIIWGPLVGIARIATGLHYLSDVVVGWLLGTSIALAILYLLPNYFPI